MTPFVRPDKHYIVITEFGLKLDLDAVELVQYLCSLSTQGEVKCFVSVLNDSEFVFNVSYNTYLLKDEIQK